MTQKNYKLLCPDNCSTNQNLFNQPKFRALWALMRNQQENVEFKKF